MEPQCVGIIAQQSVLGRRNNRGRHERSESRDGASSGWGAGMESSGSKMPPSSEDCCGLSAAPEGRVLWPSCRLKSNELH
jgi:hypothetical protein